jgi:predicted outer membrane repeat protein
VTLENLTIRHGNAAGGGPVPNSVDGGGILNRSTLSLINVAIVGNRAFGRGGGLFNAGSTTVRGATFQANVADLDGGGIANEGALVLSGSLVAGVAGNSCEGVSGKGGGLWTTGQATIRNSTFSGNEAADRGGAVYREAGTLSLNNCTVTLNMARIGGGISESMTVANSIVFNNSATSFDPDCDSQFRFMSAGHNLASWDRLGSTVASRGVTATWWEPVLTHFSAHSWTMAVRVSHTPFPRSAQPLTVVIRPNPEVVFRRARRLTSARKAGRTVRPVTSEPTKSVRRPRGKAC